MKNISLQLMLFTLFIGSVFAQQAIDSVQNLDEVIIETQRIALPFSKNSHTISVITAAEIKQMPVTSVEEVLQNVIGVDVRRRGVEGMQSDLYIRGGNFNQTLLLIDGVKLDDMQTGHHTMNGMVDLNNVERIEVIKGAAARIYGQNAMNGAINIVTKKVRSDQTKVSLSLGSFDNLGAAVSFQKIINEEASVQFQVKKRQSSGYRFNTDFDNLSAFLKTQWKSYELIATFGKRDFGANGFYASPDYKDQYEETQTSLVALKRKFNSDILKINSSVYWRSNQDEYVFLRHDPDYYHNIHENNKIGLSVDATIGNKFGKTGVGVDVNQGFLISNNLGDHNRLTATSFVEHRFQFFDSKLDITPGFALSYYSDLNFFSKLPGIDIGFKLFDSFKLYANSGLTSRVPTFTNLFYESPAEKGNPDLVPETALTTEGGVYYNNNTIHLNLAVFNRDATNIIDWINNPFINKWEAENIGEINTKGIEFSGNYKFFMNEFLQNISFGHSYQEVKMLNQDVAFSRYSLNSFRNQFTGNVQTQFLSFLGQSVSYRYTERINGENYHLVDVGLSSNIKKWDVALKANNILNVAYTETNLVPMPKLNFMGELSYSF